MTFKPPKAAMYWSCLPMGDFTYQFQSGRLFPPEHPAACIFPKKSKGR
jgi:hypothetical protein